MTPPERSSLSLSGSVEPPLVARSSGTVCGAVGPAPCSLFGNGAAILAAEPASSRAKPATKTEWRILRIGIASSLRTGGDETAFRKLAACRAVARGPTMDTMNGPADPHSNSRPERPLARIEDADLLRGRGRFADDLPEPRGVLHAAILRSPHAHAELVSINVSAALAMPGVGCVVTGEDARRWTKPFAVAVKTVMQHWCLAVDRVRYVGEPVAVVLAHARPLAGQ